MKYLLIMNPSSRSGKGRRLWTGWKKQLDILNIDYQAVETDSIEHCQALAKDAVGYDVAVAVGGDGTINAVVNGIMKSDNKSLKLGVLYSGTSPDFCVFHNIPLEPEQALNALLSDNEKSVDILNIEHNGLDNKVANDYFTCSTNIGMGKDIADEANKNRKYLGDKLGTGIALIKAITRGKRNNMKLKFGKDVMSFSNVNHLSVIKNPYIASGLKLNLELESDDNQLGLWVMHGLSRFDIMKLLPKFYSGEAGESQQGIFSRIDSVIVEINEPAGLPVEFDGDHHGYLPAKICLTERKLTVKGVGYA